MKNKTKKILAGLGLSIVGMGALTGCSLTGDQQAALDLITDKADEIVNLLEKNMEFNNTKLTKEEAAEKILLARNNAEQGLFNEFEMVMTQANYTGILDKKLESGTGTFIRKLRVDGQKKTAAFFYNEEISQIVYSDFENNEHKEYSSYLGETWQDRDYDSYDFDVSEDFLSNIYPATITAEDIMDIQVLENGYNFKVLVVENRLSIQLEITVSNDCRLMFAEAIAVSEFETLPNSNKWEKQTAVATLEFKYENVDFTTIDQKIATLSEVE